MRNVTLTFDDGSSHIYNNVPDNVTPDQVAERAHNDYPTLVLQNIDGGRSSNDASYQSVVSGKNGNTGNAHGFEYGGRAESLLPTLVKQRVDAQRFKQIGNDVASGLSPEQAATNAIIQDDVNAVDARNKLSSDAAIAANNLKKSAPLLPKPKRSLGDTYADSANTLLKVAPTTVKGVVDIANMLTGDSVDLGVSNHLAQGLQGMNKTFGSDALNYETQELSEVANNQNAGVTDYLGYLLKNPVLAADMAGTSAGSMILPTGVAGLAVKGATALKGAPLAASLASKIAGASVAGTTALQNAADTFGDQDLKDKSLSDRYAAAGISGAGTLVGNKLFGGGLEKAIADKLGGRAVMKGLSLAGKEAGQEGFESLSHSLGMEAVSPETQSFNQSIGRAIAEAALSLPASGGFAIANRLGNNAADATQPPSSDNPKQSTGIESVLSALNKANELTKQRLTISNGEEALNADDAVAAAKQAEYDAQQGLPANKPVAEFINEQSIDPATMVANPVLSELDNGIGSVADIQSGNVGGGATADPSAQSLPDSLPAATVSTPDNAVKKEKSIKLGNDAENNAFYERFNSKREVMQAWLPSMGWASEGGKLLRDADGNVIGRTTWDAKDKDFLALKNQAGVTFTAMQEAVSKAINGEKLTKKQKVINTILMDYHDEVTSGNMQGGNEELNLNEDEDIFDTAKQALSSDEVEAFLNGTNDGQGKSNLLAQQNEAGNTQIGTRGDSGRTGIESTGIESAGISQTQANEVTRSEVSGARDVVTQIVKRRAAANQLGKEKQFDTALQLAKDFMHGERVNPNKFKNAATLFANDALLSEQFSKLHELAKPQAQTARQEKTSALEGYRRIIANATNETELRSITRDIQDDESLTDAQVELLDAAVFEAQDKLQTTPEVEELQTDLLGDNTQAKQALADADRAKDAKRNTGNDNASEFNLSGSDSEADNAIAAGAQDLFAAPKSIVKETAKIEKINIDDFGEKLEGARKDMVRAMAKEYSDDEIASLPLSKLWPSTDVDLIENKTAAAIAWTARSMIPSKPRKPYAVKRWVEQVKQLREIGRLVSNAMDMKNSPALQKFKEANIDHMMDKVDLLDLLERNQWKRIGRVEAYPNAYRYEGKEKVSSPLVRVDIDGNTTSFNASSVADIVDKVNEKLGVEQGNKRMAFEVRSQRGVYFVMKKGDKNYTRLKTFDNSKDAFAFIRDNYDEVVAAWDATKDRLNVKETDTRNKENRPRTGEDYRKGKDVGSEEFATTFGFRGVQFGEWVKQGGKDNDRQGALNAAYDALIDLATIVGVPPKALSLEGSLGLSFGARGKGSAAAHFEPGNLVINLTKTKGSGTLAHEWFHALDNYFSRKRGGEMSMADAKTHQRYREGNYITYKPEHLYLNKNYGNKGITKQELQRYREQNPNSKYWSEENWILDPKHPEGVRPEVERRFADLVDALNTSPMKDRARVIDGVKEGTDGYWSRIIERAARSFENYVINKMQLNGYDNDYLANVVTIEKFNRDESRFPYLKPDEIAPVAEAFDNLFGEIKTKETDKGIALFRSADEGGAIPESEWLSEALISQEVEKFVSQFDATIPVIINNTSSDVISRATLDDGVAISGMVRQGKIHLFRDGINDTAALSRSLWHELLHYGLRRFLTKDQYIAAMNKLYLSDGFIKASADSWMKTEYATSLSSKESQAYLRARGVDEALAELSENGNRGGYSNNTLKAKTIRTISRWIANLARKFGFNEAALKWEGVTNDNARELITDIFRRLESNDVAVSSDWAFTADPSFMSNPDKTDTKKTFTDFDFVNKLLPKEVPLLYQRDAKGNIQLTAGKRTADLLEAVLRPIAIKAGMARAPVAFRKLAQRQKAELEQAMKAAGNVIDASKGMSDKERALIGRLVTRELEHGDVPPEHAYKMAAIIEQALTQQGKDLVELGFLSEETQQKWQGQYLPRLYTKDLAPEVKKTLWQKMTRRSNAINGLGSKSHKGRGKRNVVTVAELSQWEALGWQVDDSQYQRNAQGNLSLEKDGKPLPDTALVKIWKDYTREERKQMGEVDDFLPRFVTGYIDMQKDIALGRLYQSIASNPDWVRRTESEGYVYVPVSEMPDTGGLKRFGSLSGLYVKKDIYDSIQHHEAESNEFLKVYKEALSKWKETKTVLNPVTHMNNVASNITMAHFSGVSYWDVEKYAMAVHDIVKKDGYLQEALDGGLFAGGISYDELNRNMPQSVRDLLSQYKDNKVRVGARKIYNALALGQRENMATLYQFEDSFFKYVIYRDARNKGMSSEDAIQDAQDFIFNYDDLPKTARAIRDYGIPFFSYTYKLIPKLVDTATKYPWRFAAPASLIASANALIYAALAGDDDDWWWLTAIKDGTMNAILNAYTLSMYGEDEAVTKGQKLEQEERKNLPEWDIGRSALGTHKTIRRFNDEESELPVFQNVYRMVPGGDLFDVENERGGLSIPAPFMPSSPVISIVTDLIANKDFRGKEILGKHDTGTEKAKKIAKWGWQFSTPAIAPFNRHYDRLAESVAHEFDTQLNYASPFNDYTGMGNDGIPAKAEYAIPQTFGIKTREIDLEKSKSMAKYGDYKDVMELRKEVKSAQSKLYNKQISQREFDAIHQSNMDKIDLINTNRME